MNQWYEVVGNMHMHTPYSDGAKSHADIARAAISAGLDFVIVTDHNVWVEGIEGYYETGASKRVLLLVGEEVHDMRRDPQANHLLIYGADRELAQHAPNPQQLINEAQASEAVCYLAHPIERAAPVFGEDALNWVNWEVDGYTGIELWNYMSEFKSHLVSKRRAVQAAFSPDQFISGPFPETLALWDRLLREGKSVKVIGGADAHGTRYSMGPIRRVLFPYEYLFRCINTHILIPRPLSGNFTQDRQQVLYALRDGHAWIGYDLPSSTRGFRFSAQGLNSSAVMGGRIRLGHGVTLQIVSPQIADIRLIKDGEIILRDTENPYRTYIAKEPGVYRVEVYLNYKGKPRGWIFSNPIRVLGA
jgi:hypothetical protein